MIRSNTKATPLLVGEVDDSPEQAQACEDCYYSCKGLGTSDPLKFINTVADEIERKHQRAER
jgi:hypothetical protein